MKIKSLPDVGRSSSTQSILTVFDKLFYNVNEADNQLSQIDGNTDISGEDKNIPSCLYGVKCEVNELITWINFLRGFNNIWEETNDHFLCTFKPAEKSCFFCFMRSMITKLNSRGQKGPKSLKPFEVAYPLGQLEDSGFSWRNNALGVEPLIEKTLNVLQMQKEEHGENHEALHLICSKCGESSGVLQKNPINVDAETFSFSFNGSNNEQMFQKASSLFMQTRRQS